MTKKVDTQWFKERMAQRWGEPGSGRKASKALGVHESVFSRMLRDEHGWTAGMVAAMARELRVDPSEILHRVGADPHPVAGFVRLSGWVDAEGAVHPMDAGMPKRTKAITHLQNAIALLVRTPSQPTDGWVLHYDPAGEVVERVVGRLAVIDLADSRGQVVGVLRRGYQRGRYSITPFGSNSPGLAEVEILRAAPIQHIALGAGAL
jgi:hypothetical protein